MTQFKELPVQVQAEIISDIDNILESGNVEDFFHSLNIAKDVYITSDEFINALDEKDRSNSAYFLRAISELINSLLIADKMMTIKSN